MNLIWKRQLRTTIILLIVLAILIGAIFYVRNIKEAALPSAIVSIPVSQEAEAALKKYESRAASDVAVLRTTANDQVSQRVELAFAGLPNEDTMRQLLQVLQDKQIPATFYVAGTDASTNAGTLALINNSGFGIGLLYSGSATDMSDITAKRAVSDFTVAAAAIQAAVGIWPSQMLVYSPPSDTMLAAAYASSIASVVMPADSIDINEVNAQSFTDRVSALPRKSILCVRLSGNLVSASSAFQALADQLKNSDVSEQAKILVSDETAAAEALARVYTTERAVAFTFTGIGNEKELQGVLDALKSISGVGTFFLTADDLTKYPDQIQSILDGGHALGIAIQESRYNSAEALLEALYYLRDDIKNTYNYTEPLAVRTYYGSPSAMLAQACGAGKFTLVSALLNAVRTDDIRKTDASAVLAEILPDSAGYLQRGEIVHFQMRQYQKSNQMLGNLVQLMATQRNLYAVKSVMDIVNNKEYTYTYPVPEDAVLTELQGKIHTGQLTGNTMPTIAARYIGIDWVNSKNFLPGFTAEEIKRLDKTGLVKNNSNMVFLTFDDWGTDKTITELLDVLKLHNAKATFFIRTQNVVYNPNLLRAIAAEGHTIASHSRKHLPLSTDTGSGKKFIDLTDEEAATIRQDLVESYNDLLNVVGDVTVNGKPALSLLFRPPTLAVGRKGLEAVFDCGFTYSVSASYTTKDYSAKSANTLAATLKKKTKSGAVLLMHMSDNSIYTAEALDIYLTEMEKKASDKQYKFVGLDEVLK